jgi:iron complex outermembrane recepter protein
MTAEVLEGLMSNESRRGRSATGAVIHRFIHRASPLALAAAVSASLGIATAVADQAQPAGQAQATQQVPHTAQTHRSAQVSKSAKAAPASPASQARASQEGQPQLLAQASTNPPAPSSSANSTTQSQASGQLQEVVVTARYRQENLQTTPIAITALSGVDLQQLQLTNVNDLGSMVPNAYFRTPTSNYGPTETIGLRGITQVDFSYTFEPAVAVYVDDIYHATETGASLDLLDLQRVEVLNGPQGTLFGKNALGGAIRLITNKPQGSDTATLSATYGQHHLLRFTAIADYAVIPGKLNLRLVGMSDTQDGFGNDLDFACEMAARGTPADSGSLPETVSPMQGNGCSLRGYGGHNHQAGKIEFRYLASDKFTIDFDPNYTKQADQPYPQALLTPYGNAGTDLFNYLYSTGVIAPRFGINYTAYDPANPTPGSTATTGNVNFLSPSPYDNYSTYGDVVTGQQYDPTAYLSEWGLPFTFDYQLANKLDAKLILGYETYQSNWINDSDLTPFGLTQTYYRQEHRQYQAEFRLSGTTLGDRLDWTWGLFYFNSRDRAYNTTNFDAFANPFGPFTHGLLPNSVENDFYTDKEKSTFLHGAFKITHQLSVSAGVRYTDELKSDALHNVSDYPPDSLILPFPRPLSAARFDWSGSIDFQMTPSVLFYTSIATGFRSPGFNPRFFTIGQVTEIPGEEATQYEIGNKSEFFNHRLRANTAVFYLDYKEHLDTIFATQCNLPTDTNPGIPYQLNGGVCPPGTPLAGSTGSPWFFMSAAPADIRGVEEQIAAEPIDGLQLNLTFGYNQFRSKTTNPLDPSYVDPTVKQQPEINMSGSVQYSFALGSAGVLTPHIDWIYQSFMTDGPVNVPQIHPDYIIPGYSVFNVRVVFAPNEGGWSVALGLTNALNKFYWEQLTAATSSPGVPTVARVGTAGVPREWSVQITKKF